MKKILAAVTPCGNVITRTTEKAYTHATAILEESGWGVVSMSGSKELAQKQYDHWSKLSFVKDCVIIEVVEVESGLTGEDWEPTKETKYFAQIGTRYAFGKTAKEAIANLSK